MTKENEDFNLIDIEIGQVWLNQDSEMVIILHHTIDTSKQENKPDEFVVMLNSETQEFSSFWVDESWDYEFQLFYDPASDPMPEYGPVYMESDSAWQGEEDEVGSDRELATAASIIGGHEA